MFVEGSPSLDQKMRWLLVLQLKSEPNGGLRTLTSLVIVLGVARAKVRVATKPVPELLVTVATRCARDPQTVRFERQASTAWKGHGAEPWGRPRLRSQGAAGVPMLWTVARAVLPFKSGSLKKLFFPSWYKGHMLISKNLEDSEIKREEPRMILCQKKCSAC